MNEFRNRLVDYFKIKKMRCFAGEVDCIVDLYKIFNKRDISDVEIRKFECHLSEIYGMNTTVYNLYDKDSKFSILDKAGDYFTFFELLLTEMFYIYNKCILDKKLHFVKKGVENDVVVSTRAFFDIQDLDVFNYSQLITLLMCFDSENVIQGENFKFYRESNLQYSDFDFYISINNYQILYKQVNEWKNKRVQEMKFHRLQKFEEIFKLKYLEKGEK